MFVVVSSVRNPTLLFLYNTSDNTDGFCFVIYKYKFETKPTASVKISAKQQEKTVYEKKFLTPVDLAILMHKRDLRPHQETSSAFFEGLLTMLHEGSTYHHPGLDLRLKKQGLRFEVQPN